MAYNPQLPNKYDIRILRSPFFIRHIVRYAVISGIAKTKPMAYICPYRAGMHFSTARIGSPTVCANMEIDSNG